MIHCLPAPIPQVRQLIAADDDLAGIVISETDGSTFVTESGIGDQFHIGLTAEPTADVTLLIDVQEVGGIGAVPNSITLGPQNWDRPQTILLRRSGDPWQSGGAVSAVRVSVTDGTTAIGFDESIAQSLGIRLIDNSAIDLAIVVQDSIVRLVDRETGTVVQQRALTDSPVTISGGPGADQMSLPDLPEQVADIELHSDGGDDEVTGRTIEALKYDGGEGFDVVRWTQGTVADLREKNGLRNVERLVVDSEFDPLLFLSPESVAQMIEPGRGQLEVHITQSGLLDLSGEWDVSMLPSEEGPNQHRLTSGQTTIVLQDAYPLTNPLQRYDVDFDGNISAGDALKIINQIGRTADGSEQTGELQYRYYFDVGGDGTISARDALLVINALGRENQGSHEHLIANDWISGNKSTKRSHPEPEGPAAIQQQAQPVGRAAAVWDQPKDQSREVAALSSVKQNDRAKAIDSALQAMDLLRL